jgi:CSLREA domain-containing protein
MTSRHKTILPVAGLLVLVVIFSLNGVAASPPQQDPEFVFVVTTTEDHNDGFCNVDCSLREAIIAANRTESVDGIFLPSGTYTLTLEGFGEDFAATGDLDVRSGLIIIGDGPETTIIDGGGMTDSPDRVLDIDPDWFGGYEVDLWGMTITGGDAPGTAGGGIRNGFAGVTLQRCAISGNSAITGGGIHNQGASVTLQRCAISGNSADQHGGGIYNEAGALNVESSTISGNSAYQDGGGIYNVFGALSVESSTISENSSMWGGGIRTGSGDTWLKNTIVANNPSGGNCFGGGVVSEGHNLDSDNTCGLTATGDLPNTDPRLGPLQDNGGPTLTHALLFGSPAIDSGDNSACGASDQRGFTRPMDGDGDGTATCDIGAFEHLGLRARFPLMFSSIGPSP